MNQFNDVSQRHRVTGGIRRILPEEVKDMANFLIVTHTEELIILVGQRGHGNDEVVSPVLRPDPVILIVWIGIGGIIHPLGIIRT